MSLPTEGIPTDADRGDHGVRLRKGSSVTNQLYRDVDVETIARYRAKCWLFGEVGAPVAGKVRFVARDIRGNSILNESLVAEASEGVWKTMTLDFPTKSSTTRIRFLISDFRGEIGQSVVVDDCRLERLDEIPASPSGGSN